MDTREIAKFFSGVAAWEAVGHALLAFSGDLPLAVLGITITPALNALAVVIAAPLSVLLAWYAWGTGEAREPLASARDAGQQAADPALNRHPAEASRVPP